MYSLSAFPVVLSLGGSRFFDVYVPAFGIDVRVHTEELLVGGEAALKSTWDKDEKELRLARASTPRTPPGNGNDGRGWRSSSKTPEAFIGTVETEEGWGEPDYSLVERMSAMENPQGLARARLPMTLRALCRVPMLLASRRSDITGSPTHVYGKLWIE
jgi:hypothetical protein